MSDEVVKKTEIGIYKAVMELLNFINLIVSTSDKETALHALDNMREMINDRLLELKK